MGSWLERRVGTAEEGLQWQCWEVDARLSWDEPSFLWNLEEQGGSVCVCVWIAISQLQVDHLCHSEVSTAGSPSINAKKNGAN